MKRKRRRRKFSKRTTRLMFIIAVVIVVFAGIKLRQDLKLRALVLSAPKIDDQYRASHNAAAPAVATPQANTAAVRSESKSTAILTPDYVAAKIVGNAKVIGSTGLKMPLPTNMVFNKVKLGDGIEASYGFDAKQNFGMAMVSSKKPLSPEEVMNTVNNKPNTLGIPTLANLTTNSFGQPKKIDAVSGSGLGQASLWNGKNSKGEDVYIGYAPRLDKQGVYIVVVSGPNSYFETNDGFLEFLYENMQAAPLNP